MSSLPTAEHQRLADSLARNADWKAWGPYVSDRSWGTVREDYSASGDPWGYFTFDMARSRAYRWNEDGIAGVCNRFQNICLAPVFWNGRDPIFKERLFGLTNGEGNHGEDVKEYYFYLDNTPTHSYMRFLYKYPQAEYPYAALKESNRRRTREQPECELFDVLREDFLQNRYFDIFVEYAKADQEDLLCKITAYNRGPDAAPLHLLPTIWFRNTWSWGFHDERPQLREVGPGVVEAQERHVGVWNWYVEDNPDILFTHNDTNNDALYGTPNQIPYVKDSIERAIIEGRRELVHPGKIGTKAAAHYTKTLEPGEEWTVRIRFSRMQQNAPFADFDQVVVDRKSEADEFYNWLQPKRLGEDERRVQRQAISGLLWNKQFYHYSVQLWKDGDPAGPTPPPGRRTIRNNDWDHLYNLDVISMCDKWEYPYYCAWDLAFHTLPLALVDPEWAKRQLLLFLREWYMHPNGQIPAYEWNFNDVNPPVHAWACWRVYKMDKKLTGKADTLFLERVFQKLLLNFTWWVNRKDTEGHNIFQGGFLGMDNVGIFDRSAKLPGGATLEQADGTAWMAMYCLNMLVIALELARTRPAYEDVATKFFEHFIYIAHAINGVDGMGLWDDEDGFYYDMIRMPDDSNIKVKIRSFVGLVPLFAVETLEPDLLERLPRFRRRLDWFVKYRPELVANIHSLTEPREGNRRLLSLLNYNKLMRVLPRMLDESAFLSDYGLRSLSKIHKDKPFSLYVDGANYSVNYQPAESPTSMFGGNANWRGPVWFPVNYLMLESLQKYDHYYGDSLKVEMPTGSGRWMRLWQVAAAIGRRLERLFLKDASRDNRRACHGKVEYFSSDPHWRDYLPFHEYFNGDSGEGLGAAHQTGWTAMIAKVIQQCGGTEPMVPRATVPSLAANETT